MITQQQLTAVLGELPEQFSIGELVDRLVNLPVIYTASQHTVSRAAHFPAESGDIPALPVVSPAMPPASAGDAERAYYSSLEAQEVYAKFPSSPEVRALKGMAAGLSEADKQKTAKEWEAERIREKYGV